MTSAQRLLAVSLVLGVVLVAFEATALITALPTLTDELGGDSLYGVSLAAYTLANMVSLVIAGREADRRGPAPVFVISVLTFTIGLLVAGTAPSMALVVVGRTLQGAGAGGFSPIAFALVKRAFPAERQPIMYVYLSAGWVLPAVLGPLFGGLVTSAFGWRWVFIGIVPLALLVGVLAIVPMRAFGPAADADAAPNMVVPAFVAAIGVGIVVFALPADRLVLAVLGTVAGILVAGPALARILPGGVFRGSGGYPAVLTARLLAAATFIGVDAFIPLAADRIHGVAPLGQGFVLAGAAISWTFGQLVTARRPGVHASRSSLLGFVLLGAASLAAAPVVWEGWPLWITFLTWMAGGFGMGVLFNPNTVAAMSYATAGREGLVSSQVRLAESLGFSIGYGINGAFVAAADRGQIGLVAALLACFGYAATASVLGMAVSRRVRPAG